LFRRSSACAGLLLALGACSSVGAPVSSPAPARAERFLVASAHSDTIDVGSRMCTRNFGPTAALVGAATAGAVATITAQSGHPAAPWNQVPPGELVAQCDYTTRSGITISMFVDAAGHRTHTPGMRPLP